MKKRQTIILILFLSGILCFAQNPACSDGFVYMDGPSWIYAYNPAMPLSSTNPAPTTIPAFGSGLTLMPNISGGTLSPTFYATSNGTYWEWDGVAWINTGHSTGNSAAVNIAGCGGTIYNLVGSTGVVYSYNGSSSGTSLTTLSGFNGGGPYDLVTDCNCNFYALNTTTPNQGLSMYNASGVLQCTYTLSGMPNSAGGGGFAIIGNSIYVKNNGSPGFYIGTISGNGVSFSSVTGFSLNPGDFASCSVCYPVTTLAGSAISGGSLSCTIPTINVVVSTTASPVSYSWSGPGIIGLSTGSIIAVNAPGTYSCILTTGTCPPAQITLTTAIVSNSLLVLAAISPSGTVCTQSNGSAQLTVAHSHTSNAVMWNGPSIPTNASANTVTVTLPGTYTVNVTDIYTGCTATDVVTVHLKPIVSLALSNTSICAQNYNGSPASITISPTGALNYTLLTSSNYSTSSPNGTVMPCSAVSIAGNFSSLATATLIGSSAFCSDTSTAQFYILPNPVLTLSQTSGSICLGGSKLISVSGASQYLWSGGAGLSSYLGPNVTASPTVSSVYSVMGNNTGCKSQTQTVSINVLPIPTVSISPATATICAGSSTVLTATGTATAFVWNALPGLGTPLNASTVSVTPPSTMVYFVVGYLNSCTNTASAKVQIVQPPVLGLTLSNTTLCAQNFNNSANSITLMPSGALNYTLLAGSGVSVGAPNGPVMQVTPVAPFLTVASVQTATLIGQSGVCTIAITKTFVVLPNPELTVSPPSASTCPGHSKAFSVLGATTYTWLPMPSYTLSGNNSIVANPTLTSFYSVIGSSLGCNSAVKNAVLLVLPIPEVTLSPKSTTVCAGNSVLLNAEGNGAFYSWTPSVTLSGNWGSQVTATPLSLQNYTVTSTLNTCTNQAVCTVSVIVMPVLYATASQPTICSSASTQLNVSGANSFLWFPNTNLNSSSGNLVLASPNESTTYTVHGYNGICTGSTSVYVKTIQRPNMDLLVATNALCSGSSLPMHVTGAENYTWSPQSALLATSENSAVIAAPLITTNYTVFGANSIGSVSCYQQLSYSVMVVPDILPTVSQNVSICDGAKTTLYAGGGNSFSWTPSDGLNTTLGSGVVARPTLTTIYTVEVSYNSFCGRTTTVMVTVNPKPEVFAGRDTSYNLNDAMFITASGTGTLTWVRGESIVCADCPFTQIYPKRNSCYLVESINEYGCKETDDICITLTEDFSIYIPNTFSPNSDGLNDQFLIFGENIEAVSMEIYNRWGVKLFYSEDYSVGWDGKYKDVICQLGTYTYIIRYTGLNRKKYVRTGNVNIVK